MFIIFPQLIVKYVIEGSHSSSSTDPTSHNPWMSPQIRTYNFWKLFSVISQRPINPVLLLTAIRKPNRDGLGCITVPVESQRSQRMNLEIEKIFSMCRHDTFSLWDNMGASGSDFRLQRGSVWLASGWCAVLHHYLVPKGCAAWIRGRSEAFCQ